MIKYNSLIYNPLFWSKVSIHNGCWLWFGSFTSKGYGQYSRYRAHRYAYEQAFGKADPKLVIDHLCCNKACVNPYHLQLVTSGHNTLRSANTPAYKNKYKTRCKHGHEFNEENTRWWRGMRQCKECARQSVARRKANTKCL